ncbi:ABC transporter ATP-binding protein [Micromonospora sp. STR1_7]|uniref:ABC transporter ATP-binding protein n=1 Tax=Micromonospora parastrephiae TaxID=2806101 RepID=A0ABS1XNK4_9ACTN|nr:ABC transporter ATP-binding protein [Micromonospora parastrephiae]MBM0230824.1 ABC transporter ATP-binding protein [Micromonospora parastrephiae]
MRELRFEQVSVRFGSRRRGTVAVDGVDLVVPAGTVVGLVGESGSGKSTLARAAVGLAPLTGGRILLDGRPVREMSRAAGRPPLQMVFQDPYSALDPRMSIGDSIAEAIPRQPASTAAQRRAEVGRLLELVGLPADRAGVRPDELSGGQRQRVALARALAGRPEVIVADEITSALDVSIQGAVLNVVRELQRRMRLTMLFISHNLAVVRYVSDVVAVMYLGRIVEYGPAADVLGDPQHPYTRELLAAVPRAGAPLPQPPGESADADPPDPHQPPSGCRFHPRCPVGPQVVPGRDRCRDSEPSGAGHRNLAACHFAAAAGQARP